MTPITTLHRLFPVILFATSFSLAGCRQSGELETAFDYATEEQIQAAQRRDADEANEEKVAKAEAENEE
ncbi:hypothetical protein [Roseiconus lacunae]|uniref:Secreted protein n=1 Tax=Roseiconus lacunae TaxID=2605694 RepID=A0ABT7PBP4_9BACT|nr:hypothetical protein [Roseiconus lacunae]MCD0462432.1 hypothetical protein [Roseiconus lacunae]MDM4013915.1 hypothetical protein [Roseiconus lacunae]